MENNQLHGKTFMAENVFTENDQFEVKILDKVRNKDGEDEYLVKVSDNGSSNGKVTLINPSQIFKQA